MDSERLSRLLAGVMVPIAVVGALLSLATGDAALAVVFAVVAGVGAFAYWAVPRYASEFDDAVPDLTTTRTFVASLFKLVVFVLEFALVGYLCIQFGLVTWDELASTPAMPGLVALGVLPGAFMGAGVPYLAQREVVFHRLSTSYAGQIAASSLTFGAYLALLAAAPSAVATYVAAYVGSRIAVLVGGQAWARR